ncbi:hypothetical protein V7S43_009364 [Phytophthora oleae]|uniref:protein-tyrosine-phosphatase n=1 Tax=Phytophthora oleae TaxID=2107226 RepID=A0ABD3FF01_9STRA
MRKAPGLRLQTSIVQDNIPVEVTTGVFVGSVHAAFNVEALKSNKISHVLNLAGSYATFPEDFTYLSLSIRDKEYASLLSCLPIAMVFIDAGLKSGGVLVHCAGGRSRSPAVVMAFLMMKQQMSYADASAQVKALRPVVSLNVGFDAQLKCLETARGDVFEAHQHLIKARLAHLAKLQESGDLASDVARKRRQPQQAASQSPRPPLLKKQSSVEMLASGCDDRGMVGERVPSGFCLSIPQAKATLEKASVSSFIPALRSMGTMFGCQCCGESLFCAGAIVHHHEMSKYSDNSRFLGALRGQTTINFTVHTVPSIPVDGEQVVPSNVSKNPLLSKLRLRPHSPSVTMGNGLHGGKSSNLRKSASPVLTKPNFDFENLPKGDDGSGTSQPMQNMQLTRRPVTEEGQRASLSKEMHGELRKKAGTGLWRSLTFLKSSKRTSKAEDKRTQTRSGISEIQKPIVSTEDAKELEVGQTPAHLVFLKRNAMEWHRSIQQLVDISMSDSFQEQMAALLDEDATVLTALNGCKQWFVEPQLWTIEQASVHSEGAIRCPRKACGAVVGEWRWEGLRYSCGGSMTPAFVMKKDAVCVLGNMTSQSIELMNIANSEIHPEIQ